MTGNDENDLPDFDTGYTQRLNSLLDRYRTTGHVAVIEDAMRFCEIHKLSEIGAGYTELKALVDEVVKLHGERNSRTSPRKKAQRGPKSGAGKHIERFVKVEQNLKAQAKAGKKPSIRKALREVAVTEPMVEEDAVRKSHQLVRDASSEIVPSGYDREFDPSPKAPRGRPKKPK